RARGVDETGAAGESAAAEVGVWEMTPGTATDVEADEVFVVLSGRATLTFEDGETLELHPGVVVRLHEGERTTWAVHETIRKIYVTPAATQTTSAAPESGTSTT
ncbi:MAG TPA: cupin domain-containing protein, partial [Humibacillus xanthopallidus]|nr:cupin domain-containing protein [Humibacillus xanthopallidus]